MTTKVQAVGDCSKSTLVGGGGQGHIVGCTTGCTACYHYVALCAHKDNSLVPDMTSIAEK